MNLHKVLEELIATDNVESFVKALPGFVAVPNELWEQLTLYLKNLKSRCAAQERFLEERHFGDGTQVLRTRQRQDNVDSFLEAMETRKPLVLKRCNCWYAANTGEKHPDGFACHECHNTGKVQLR